MDGVHKIPNPVPTSACVSSFAEAENVFGKLAFPIIAIPFGAEAYGTQAWLFQTGEGVTREALDILFSEAIPTNGISKVHLISVATTVLNAPWQTLLAKGGPRIDLFYT